MLLLETHFTNLSIPAPVIALKIEIKKFDAFMSHSNSLLSEGKPTAHYNDNNLNKFMEQLRARLGDDHIKSISTAAEHCPEYASQQLNYEESIQSNQSNAPIVKNIRPFWLLPEPLLLNIRRGKLYHRKALTIINGPERIETYWWSGTDVCRDYYVAKEQNGSRLWIYHEKQGERNWYLHGFFS
jgi:protein ImuB